MWYGNPDWWQAIFTGVGVIATIIVAILAIFGSEIRARIRRPRFSYTLKETTQHVGGNLVTMFRLRITNTGRTAEGLSVAVVQIMDKKREKWVERENFIHMPLNWTHLGFEPRSIYSNQDAYVDVGLYDFFEEDNDKAGLHLATHGVDEKDLYIISNDAKVKIRFSEANGFSDEIIIKVNWKVEAGGPVLDV